ncbi:hypothetical protein N474_05020 [Pseudoalteromonas luteoviolacea CPMOR-2]|uniref:Uncharacterized protein n=1 Tax=Pseudoalteromonas luteoviolacea DSM 6061 TaxID=1365250 RepID=A0A166WKR0_9GAMM|nr:hypothetical protein [Pseudoalteromonas luteoviolacea]KZN37595.1 hypothetical protein N475_01930 [Pseudoalteromonas luteoviolacea DSM 6061]KZN49621.1 hypothetical protein N474_05020 [Pseudoalteromonas luteoviolacea CPMOR-2]MBE0386989.1 hypothetical protein [Pseudoalteromonas luteoviolacea DSM 6061]
MSSDNLSITERLTNVSARANALCDTVQSQIGNINNTVSAAETKFDNYMSGARAELSHILMSKNQKMEPNDSGTAIKGFTTIGLERFEVIKEATIYAAAANDTDHTGKGVAQDFRTNVYNGYVNSGFHILRIKWKRNDASHPARIDNNYWLGFQQGALSTGCYLKLISGSIEGTMQPVKEYSNGWQLLGYHQRADNPSKSFYGPHTKLGLSSSTLEEGEALICLFGSVSGFVDFETAGWGVYPEFARLTDVSSAISQLRTELTP